MNFSSGSSDEGSAPRTHAELPQRPLQYAKGGPKSKRTRTQGADDMDEDFANSASSSTSSPISPSSNNDAAANHASFSTASSDAILGNMPNVLPTMDTNQTLSSPINEITPSGQPPENPSADQHMHEDSADDFTKL